MRSALSLSGYEKCAVILTYGLRLSFKRLASFKSSLGAAEASDISRTSILKICV